jgi:DNA polymerase III sliding clamp (beta) subunit (PCNA family)
MKVDKKYKALDKIASKDETRYMLTGIHVVRTEAEKGYVEATDGRRLCRVPAEFDKDEPCPEIGKDCVLSPQFWKQAVKDSKGSYILIILSPRSAKTLGQVEMPLLDGTYPNTSQVVPDIKAIKNIGVIGFNPDFLSEMAEAVGQKGQCELVVDADNMHAPVSMASAEADCVAIVMPLRVSNVRVQGNLLVSQTCPIDKLVMPNPLFPVPAPEPAPAPAPETAPGSEPAPVTPVEPAAAGTDTGAEGKAG